MGYRTLTLEGFNDLLQQWNGKRVKVVKHETGDRDETIIDLHVVSYANDEPDIDGYESQYTLHLNGAGLIETTMNNYEALPSNLYEIPLEDDAFYEFDGARFIISTSRGVYTMELHEW